MKKICLLIVLFSITGFSLCLAGPIEPIISNSAVSMVTPSGIVNYNRNENVTLTANKIEGCKYQWQKNDKNIKGATSNKYLAGTAGLYKVIITSKSGNIIVSNTVSVYPSNKAKLSDCKCKDKNRAGLNNIYPNPFSSSTQVDYTVSETSDVIIKIYNLVGQEVSTLVNTTQENGKYTVNFEAGDLQNGIYFCRVDIIGQTKRYNKTSRLVISR